MPLRCRCYEIKNAVGLCRLTSHSAADPILIDTGMSIMSAQWNHMGAVLAIAGTQRAAQGDKDVNVVQFYNPFGEVNMQYSHERD